MAKLTFNDVNTVILTMHKSIMATINMNEIIMAKFKMVKLEMVKVTMSK